MSLETGTYISDLNSANPVGTDVKSQGDDHIRLVKSTILATFPNVTGAITPTHTDLNQLLNAGSHAGMLSDIGLLDDPLADRLLFWDESAGAAGLLSLTTGLSLSGTSLGIDTSVVPQLAAANSFTNIHGIRSTSGTGPRIEWDYTSGASGSQAIDLLVSSGAVALRSLTDDFNTNQLTLWSSNIATGALTVAGSLLWGGGSAIDSSSHVALTNASNTFSIGQNIDGAGSQLTIKYSGTAIGTLVADGSSIYLSGATSKGLGLRTNTSGNALSIDASQNFNFYAGTVTTSNSSASEVGYKGVPLLGTKSADYTYAAGDQGSSYQFTAGTATIPANVFNAGDAFVILNRSGSAMTVAQGASLTMYLAGTTSSGNRSLAANGMATVYFLGTTSAFISGAGIS